MMLLAARVNKKINDEKPKNQNTMSEYAYDYDDFVQNCYYVRWISKAA